MSLASKLMSRAGATILALVGVALLVAIAPRRAPWDMTRFDTLADDGRVRVVVAGWPVEFSPAVLYAGLALLLLAIAGCSRGVREVVRRLASRPRHWVPAVGCLVYLLFTLVPSSRASEINLGLVIGLVGVALLTAGLTLFWPPLAKVSERRGRAIVRWVSGLPSRLLVGVVFCTTFLAAGLGSLVVFGRIPHIVDAVDQLFHAKIFLLGRLFAPSTGVGEYFAISHMIDNGRWYSQYPPGHTLLLAVGQLFRAPWLVNPLFGGLSVALLYKLGQEMFDERTARLAAILGAISPFLLLMSSSFMSHGTTLFFLLLFLYGFVGLLTRGRPLDGLLAGVGLGFALNIRPMTALAVASPFLFYGAYHLVAGLIGRGVRRPARFYLACLLAAAVCSALVGGLLWFNQQTNGDPLLFGYEVLHGKGSRPGFGNSGWWNIPHTPGRGLTWTLENFNALNLYLLGLPFPSLVFALGGLVWSRPKIWDLLLLGSLTVLAIAYFCYWYHDWALGPRFLYESTGPLLLLTARGLVTLPGLLRRWLPAERAAAATGRLYLALLIGFAYALLISGPSMAAFYSRNYADGNSDVLAAVDELALSDVVVFVGAPYYATVFARNDPLLRGPVIYARDYGLERSRELMRRFPGRRAYRLLAGEDYTLVPYDEAYFSEPLAYPLLPATTLTVEFNTAQASFFRNGFWRDQRMGEWGGHWKHHDQLLVTAQGPGAEVGLIVRSDVPQRRSLLVVLTRGPDFGIVRIQVGNSGPPRTVDLYSDEIYTKSVLLEDVAFRPGLNRLSIAVIGKNDRSRSFGMGLDFVSIR